ncbi:MAG TPA: thioredoxin domain-containing protein [Rhizomicrobium sp.]|nr:thioredoxin domain-containing protein [Rhizomicrobium sp.]
MKSKQWVYAIVGVAIVAVLVAAYFVLYGGGQGEDANAADGTGNGKVAITRFDRSLGNPKAPIQIVEYAAPVCPHCAHFNETLFPQLKSNYIDTGKVFYVFRVFPLQSADVAAEAIARCLPANNYFQFIDLLFRNQPKWDPENGVQDVHAGLVQMGRIAGLSAQQVDTCIGNQAEQKRIVQVGQDATSKFGVNGTPTFIVNGEVRSVWANYQDMKDSLDSKLKKHSA